MLKVDNITKKYGKSKVLDGVSFTINPGEKVALVGRNGCGKSTLMQILSGAFSPQSGEISFFGQNPLKNRRLFSRFVGYVPQEPLIIPELSVKDNLKFWDVQNSPNYDYILEKFGLKDILNVRAEKLSGGMKKRLSIACAIATWPPILLLDEPTSALDLYYKDTILGWLTEYNNLNGIVLLSTHEVSEILSCDRILFLKDGKINEVAKDENTLDNIRALLN